MSTVISTTQGSYVVVESLDEIKEYLEALELDLQGPLVELTTIGPDGTEMRLALNTSHIVSVSNRDD